MLGKRRKGGKRKGGKENIRINLKGEKGEGRTSELGLGLDLGREECQIVGGGVDGEDK